MPRWLEHRIPPPVIDLAFATLMWWLARALPQARLWPRGGGWLVWVAAIALALAGALIALAGVREFARARTTINPLAPERASRMVSSGIFSRTRNPMYLGMLLALAGWAVWLGNAAAWLALPLFVAVLTVLQIRPEERALRQRFGAQFDHYAARVRRWL
ncbi:MAG: isoprenylcysteine carboxylmethyltransferase family protein [Desulfovibrionaceae bacterium]|jgi:protein-S-isoprenylcysteine O-methyltransferase Ste14|nr:isoprenylcysteine carboxylmethyltransferase family protein [Desulfovibrionaceae bacterium]